MLNKNQIEILKQELDINLTEDKLATFNEYLSIFLKKNALINLISKNDEKVLFEKHIFDSLALNKFLNPKEGETLLDIGTGGGFPSIPLAILYSNLDIYPLDSIKKKIKVINEIKDELKLENVHPICDRAENIEQKFDYITTRAVSSLNNILKYAIPHLKPNGYFIAYKSQKITEELKEAEKTIKTMQIKIIKTIEYALPLEEIHNRNLIIFQRK